MNVMQYFFFFIKLIVSVIEKKDLCEHLHPKISHQFQQKNSNVLKISSSYIERSNVFAIVE